MKIISPGAVPAENCAGRSVDRSSALRTLYLTLIPDNDSNLARMGKNASISAPDHGPTTVIVGGVSLLSSLKVVKPYHRVAADSIMAMITRTAIICSILVAIKIPYGVIGFCSFLCLLRNVLSGGEKVSWGHWLPD